MVSIISRVDTAHRDVIHDAQMNYFGTKLATCSSDRLVKIFELKPSGQTYPVAELSGHDGPVWQVAWAHPKFDNVLASCSYDKKVIVWKEIAGKWQKIYEWNQHEASINAISWAPHFFGLTLACASADTSITLLTFAPQTGMWNSRRILKAHDQGCNAVSWAPAIHPITSQAGGASAVKRIVSGGNDSLVKIWKEKNDGTWELEHSLKGHTDWVRDVAWAPAIAQSISRIASCGQDRKALIWQCSNLEAGQWTSRELDTFSDVLWHVSWSLCATILAVSGGDNKVTLWKENTHETWVKISDTEEDEGSAEH